MQSWLVQNTTGVRCICYEHENRHSVRSLIYFDVATRSSSEVLNGLKFFASVKRLQLVLLVCSSTDEQGFRQMKTRGLEITMMKEKTFAIPLLTKHRRSAGQNEPSSELDCLSSRQLLCLLFIPVQAVFFSLPLV